MGRDNERKSRGSKVDKLMSHRLNFSERIFATVFAIAGMALFAITILRADAAHSADYPNHPIRIVVPWPAGGPTDAVARVLAQEMSEQLGQPIVIDNKAGATGSIGSDNVAKSPPDGYTIVVSNTASHALGKIANPKLPYDPVRDFKSIIEYGNYPVAIMAATTLPAKNLKEFIALAKAKPNGILFGSSGAGSIQRLVMELMAQDAGVKLLHIPYKGSNEAVAGMLGGDIQALYNGVSNFVELLAANKLRALAVATDQRSSQLPNVPTVKEATDGALKNVDTGSWFGLFAPAGTPPAIVAQVQRDLAAVLADPEVRKTVEQRGFIPVASTPAQFGETIKAETVRWQQVIKEGNIKPE